MDQFSEPVRRGGILARGRGIRPSSRGAIGENISELAEWRDETFSKRSVRNWWRDACRVIGRSSRKRNIIPFVATGAIMA